MFEQLDARGPRLVAQKAIETFLGEALLPAPDAEARSATEQSYRGPGLGLDLDGPHLRRPRQPDDANVCGQERRSLPLLALVTVTMCHPPCAVARWVPRTPKVRRRRR